MNPLTIFGLCLCFLFAIAKAGAWQSYGNFTADNITFIKTTLDAVIPSFEANSATQGEKIAKNISDTLNNAWSQAWNVVLYFDAAPTSALPQSVVYGYAFNNHWLWYNYYTTKTSVVIWKDYNCEYWTGLTQSNGMLAADIVDSLDTYIPAIKAENALILDDPWLFSFKLINKIQTANPDTAFTIVTMQSSQKSYGYACVKLLNDMAQFTLQSTTSADGKKQLDFYIFRMR